MGGWGKGGRGSHAQEHTHTNTHTKLVQASYKLDACKGHAGGKVVSRGNLAHRAQGGGGSHLQGTGHRGVVCSNKISQNPCQIFQN